MGGEGQSLAFAEDPRDDEISALRAYVAELEQALQGAIFIADKDVRVLSCALSLTRCQAAVVVALYNSRCPLTAGEISDLIPLSNKNVARKDPEFRTNANVNTWTFYIRSKWRKDAIVGRTGGLGYWLTDEARAEVAAILAHAY